MNTKRQRKHDKSNEEKLVPLLEGRIVGFSWIARNRFNIIRNSYTEKIFLEFAQTSRTI